MYKVCVCFIELFGSRFAYFPLELKCCSKMMMKSITTKYTYLCIKRYNQFHRNCWRHFLDMVTRFLNVLAHVTTPRFWAEGPTRRCSCGTSPKVTWSGISGGHTRALSTQLGSTRTPGQNDFFAPHPQSFHHSNTFLWFCKYDIVLQICIFPALPYLVDLMRPSSAGIFGLSECSRSKRWRRLVTQSHQSMCHRTKLS